MAVFALKSGLLKARRGVIDALGPVRRLPRGTARGDILAEIVTPLYTETDPHERALQLGKVQNLRVGAKRLEGLSMQAGDIFSFWAHIGRPTRAKGFVEGRELRQGCLIPTLAGGLCQLSNSLHMCARKAGFEILERHGHTAPVPNSPFAPGEDATVYWNYVDLRFRATRPAILRVWLTARELVVRLEVAA